MATPRTPRKRAGKGSSPDLTAQPDVPEKGDEHGMDEANADSPVPMMPTMPNPTPADPAPSAPATNVPVSFGDTDGSVDDPANETPDESGDATVSGAEPFAVPTRSVPPDPTTEPGADFSKAADEPTQPVTRNFDRDGADTPPAPVARRSRVGSFLTLLLGGAIAAGIGYVVARYLPPDDATAGFRSELAQQGQDISSLKSTMSTLPNASDSSEDIASVRDVAAKALSAAEAAQTALEAPRADLDALTQRVAGIEKQVSDLRSAGQNAVDPAAVTDLQDKVSDMQTTISDLQAQLDSQKKTAADLEAEAKTARDAVEKAQSQTAAAQAKADADAATARLASAAAQLDAAIASGTSFAEPLATLKAEGIAVPDTLAVQAKAGVPTLASLVKGFDAPARDALNASRRTRANGSLTSRLGAFVQSQTGARSLTPQEGDSPDAILSRADAALRAGNLAQALTEVSTLPPEGREAMQGWIQNVQARQEAVDASAAVTKKLGER